MKEESEYIQSLQKTLVRNFNITFANKNVRMTTFWECIIFCSGSVVFDNCDFVDCRFVGTEPIMKNCKEYHS